MALGLGTAALCLLGARALAAPETAPPRLAAETVVSGPFAGSGLDLRWTPESREALHEALVVESRRYTDAEFAAFVDGDAAAIERALASRGGGRDERERFLWDLYGGLVGVTSQARKPLSERAARAALLARRLQGVLEAAERVERLPVRERAALGRFRERLADGTLVTNLLHARRAEQKLAQLQSLLEPQADAVEAAAPPLPPLAAPPTLPAPPLRRTRDPNASETLTETLSEREAALAATTGRVRSLQRRREAVARGRFSAAFAEKVERRARHELAGLSAWARAMGSVVRRTAEFTLPMTLIVGKAPQVFHLPNNRGLDLVEESAPTWWERLRGKPRRYAIVARFKTSIEDRRVWDIARQSIEQEWRGEFSLGGERYALRTLVSIEPLAPGEAVADGEALLLSRTKGPASRGGAPGIWLASQWGWVTPAHEFGHVLGLRDDYEETFDFDVGRLTINKPRGSLMGNSAHEPGLVQARHLRRAFLLLRRRRLIPASR